MPNAASDKLDSMMKKVEALLARADHPNTPDAEADSARAMAERIMVKYKIEEEDLLARGELSLDGMNVLFKDIAIYNVSSEYGSTYGMLCAIAAEHAGCYGVYTGWRDSERILTMVGYEADIRYAEALFMSARLHFADRMEPKPDPSLSDAENVYRMRSAGMERIRIANLMGWAKGGAKVTRLYKQECERRGEDPTLTGQGTSVKDYRAAYAEGFWVEFNTRLRNARIAIEAENNGGLVLHGRKERIMEAVYERWPSLRPDTTPAKPNKSVKSHRWTKADEKRWLKSQNAVAQAGRQAGKRAAQEVDVKSATPKKRLAE